MPSLRLLCVVALAGIGAAATGLAGDPQPGDASQHQVAASAATPRSTDRPAARSAPAAGFDVRAENARPGTRDWRITASSGAAAGLTAYAGAVSVRSGARVPLHVSGRGAVRVRAYRVGWYDGAGARQVWAGSLTATPGAADPATWAAAVSADTTGWPPGDYLFRLDLGAASRYVPLTVRSPAVTGQLVLVTSPLTWQAEDPAPGSGQVSLDRPYEAAAGAGGFLTGDLPIIQLAERDGTHLAYLTDADLAADPALLQGATGVAFGSSRYWTAPMRTAVIAAIGSGTNAAFFGAGTGTHRLTLAADGRSVQVLQTVPPATTALTGLRPVCPRPGSSRTDIGIVTRPWVVQDPAWWGYAGAGVSAGQELAGLVGAEPDGTDGTASADANSTDGPNGPNGPNGPDGPDAGQVLARSPIACNPGAPSGPQTAIYWADASGAAVFSTGTTRWVCAAGGTCTGQGDVPVPTRRVAAQVTRTILEAFAIRAAARAHPVT